MHLFVSGLLCLFVASPAGALTLLTAGKRVVLTPEGARVHIGSDRAFRYLPDGSCPAGASIEITGYDSATGLIGGGPTVPLPCERWSAGRDGWSYRDDSGSAGGIQRIHWSRKGLDVRAGGVGWVPISGPVGFVQVWFSAFGERYLIRFHALRANGPSRIESRRTSRLGTAGEAAFWDTLWGDADRQDEALSLLQRASAEDPLDARSLFLEGMLRLYRFGRAVTNYPDATPEQAIEVDGAQAAFDRAVPLLWNGVAGDSRALGFSAGTHFVQGVLHGDPEVVDQARREMAEAAAANPLFNTFIPIGTAPPIASPADAAYTEVLRLIDEYFPVVARQCGTQEEICFNAGMAPHNLEGTLAMFGDVYAKGQRLEQARVFYQQAITLGEPSGWRPEFVASTRDRLATLADRAARWADADPSNDPPLLGIANATCGYCHYR